LKSGITMIKQFSLILIIFYIIASTVLGGCGSSKVGSSYDGVVDGTRLTPEQLISGDLPALLEAIATATEKNLPTKLRAITYKVLQEGHLEPCSSLLKAYSATCGSEELRERLLSEKHFLPALCEGICEDKATRNIGMGKEPLTLEVVVSCVPGLTKYELEKAKDCFNKKLDSKPPGLSAIPIAAARTYECEEEFRRSTLEQRSPSREDTARLRIYARKKQKALIDAKDATAAEKAFVTITPAIPPYQLAMVSGALICLEEPARFDILINLLNTEEAREEAAINVIAASRYGDVHYGVVALAREFIVRYSVDRELAKDVVDSTPEEDLRKTLSSLFGS
jgi:hypothetical protein